MEPTSSTNPSRVNPQTRKANNKYTSLIKTLGLVSRWHPSAPDKGRAHAMETVERLVTWHSGEMTTLRGEPWTRTDLGNLLSSSNLENYRRENWENLSSEKQAEARVAWAILEQDVPLTKSEFDAMFVGISVNLRGVKRSYRKKQGI